MNREIIHQIQQINEEYLSRYFSTAVDHENVIEPECKIPIWDKTNLTKFGLEYFDLILANILLHRHYDVKCELTANIAELTTRLSYEGLRRIFVFDNDEQTAQFCHDVAVHRAPNLMMFYQYLNYIQRYEHNRLPIWFYYTLLLWAFVDTKQFDNTANRSRFFVNYCHYCMSVQFTDYNSDRKLDTFVIKRDLNRLIYMCFQDERFSKDSEELELYMIDSLRIFSTILFAAICSRSMYFKEFCRIGKEIISQKLFEHQCVVDKNYVKQITKNKLIVTKITK